MKFKIHYKAFKDAVTRIADAALIKGKKPKIRCWAEVLTLDAKPKSLKISAFGEIATIQIDFLQGESEYECMESGEVSVTVVDFIATVHSIPDGYQLLISTQDGQIQLCMESCTVASLPFLNETLPSHRLCEQYNSEVTVDRDLFLRGMKKVKYAMAKEENMMCYQCILFEAWENTMRFTAGCGGRFTVFEITDDNPPKLTPDRISITIPKTNINNLIRIFNKVDSPLLQVKYLKKYHASGLPEHILLLADNVTMMIYNGESQDKYFIVDKVLNRTYPYEISTCAKDWKRVVEAVCWAQANHIDFPNTQISADLQKGCFDVRVNGNPSFLEHIEFKLGHYIVDEAKEKHYQPWFRCQLAYIEDVAQKMDKADTIQVCFEDQAILDDIPEGKPLKMMPTLIRFPPTKGRDGVTETLNIFFAISTK